MPNYQFKNQSVSFLVNGADKKASFKIITILIALLTLFFISFFVLMKMVNGNSATMILGGILVFLAFLGAVFVLFYYIRMGAFAPYRVEIDAPNLELFKKGTALPLFVLPFKPENLYLAQIRQQVGYASVNLAALCYGPTKQIFVEDTKPSPDLIVLCSGPKEKIEEIHHRIFDIC